MSVLQMTSVSEPLAADPAVGTIAARLVSRLHYLGLLPEIDGPVEIDRALLLLAFTRLAEVGVGQKARMLLQRAKDPDTYLTVLQSALEQIDESPLPENEWHPVMDTLGEAFLAGLTGVSPSSLRRYAAGERMTPDDVAARLHFIALVIADLYGAYNDYGIRRWFDRRRVSLGDRAPRDLLGASFDPDAPETRRLRELAAELVGAGAT
jgi:hypothetical protein